AAFGPAPRAVKRQNWAQSGQSADIPFDFAFERSIALLVSRGAQERAAAPTGAPVGALSGGSDVLPLSQRRCSHDQVNCKGYRQKAIPRDEAGSDRLSASSR